MEEKVLRRKKYLKKYGLSVVLTSSPLYKIISKFSYSVCIYYLSYLDACYLIKVTTAKVDLATLTSLTTLNLQQTAFLYLTVSEEETSLIFHVNRLLADSSHEM